MSKDWFEDMVKMHSKYQVDTWMETATPEMKRKWLEFRVNFLEEELNETRQALANGDPEEIVDGLIDLCVIAIGTLEAYRVDAHTAWNEVYVANMAKVIGVKESRPNPLGLPDLVKPEGWVAPSHSSNHGDLKDIF